MKKPLAEISNRAHKTSHYDGISLWRKQKTKKQKIIIIIIIVFIANFTILHSNCITTPSPSVNVTVLLYFPI